MSMNLLQRRPVRSPAAGYRRSAPVTIRWATPADARLVDTLAELDEAVVPPAPLLLAFVGDEPWVAMSLATGEVVCDPFRPSAELVELLRERGRQLTVPDRPRRRLRVMRLLTQPW
jgi:hypothetical protein